MHMYMYIQSCILVGTHVHVHVVNKEKDILHGSHNEHEQSTRQKQDIHQHTTAYIKQT